MTAYFTTSNCGFIAADFKNDGTYQKWPDDAVLLTDDEAHIYWGQPAPAGKMLGVVDSRPAWVDLPIDVQRANVDHKKQELMRIASSEIAWRQDAVDVGMATAEEAAALTEWKKFRVMVMRVDITNPIWPSVPE